MRRLLAALATLALLAGCDTNEGPPDAQASQSVQAFAQIPTAPNTTDKVVVFVIENKSFAQIQAGAPKLWALGQEYAYASNFTAITHPSLPNYIAIAAGSTLGIKDDKTPSSHKLKQANVFSGAWANGRSAKIVADGMFTDRCRQSNYRNYVPRHVPWTYFVNDRALCEKYVFDFKYFAGDVAAAKLANVEAVIPNQCNNAHNCSLSTADKWVAARVDTLMAGPDWQSGRLTIVLTADEDDRKNGNRIFTAVLHPSLSHKVVTSPLSLYSLSGMLSDFGHSPRLLNATTAPDMAAAFGLSVN